MVDAYCGVAAHGLVEDLASVLQLVDEAVSSSSWRSEPMEMGVSGMVPSGVGSWSVGGRIIANVGLIYNLAVWLG